MAELDVRDTAKIYDLSAFRRSRPAQRVSAPIKPVPAPSLAGGSWYHEAAIRDDERPRQP